MKQKNTILLIIALTYLFLLNGCSGVKSISTQQIESEQALIFKIPKSQDIKFIGIQSLICSSDHHGRIVYAWPHWPKKPEETIKDIWGTSCNINNSEITVSKYRGEESSHKKLYTSKYISTTEYIYSITITDAPNYHKLTITPKQSRITINRDPLGLTIDAPDYSIRDANQYLTKHLYNNFIAAKYGAHDPKHLVSTISEKASSQLSEDASGRVVADGVGTRSLKQDYSDINKSLKMAKKSTRIDATRTMNGEHKQLNADEKFQKGCKLIYKSFQKPISSSTAITGLPYDRVFKQQYKDFFGKDDANYQTECLIYARILKYEIFEAPTSAYNVLVRPYGSNEEQILDSPSDNKNNKGMPAILFQIAGEDLSSPEKFIMKNGKCEGFLSNGQPYERGNCLAGCMNYMLFHHDPQISIGALAGSQILLQSFRLIAFNIPIAKKEFADCLDTSHMPDLTCALATCQAASVIWTK